MDVKEQSGEWVELAERRNDGLEIRLLWERASGAVKVTVRRVTGTYGELRVDPADALTAFYHPFAYTPAPCRPTPSSPARTAARASLPARRASGA